MINLVAVLVPFLAQASAPAGTGNQSPQNSFRTAMQYHQIIDQQRGIVQAALPFPDSWEILGEHYRVEDGSNHYWVNNDGLYIATGNALFDPHRDSRINHHEWTRFVKEQ